VRQEDYESAVKKSNFKKEATVTELQQQEDLYTGGSLEEEQIIP
jgi:hypothetical protein